MNAVLETPQLEVEFIRTFSRKAVNDPLGMAATLDHAMFPEIREMFGNGDLIKIENCLEVTDAKLAIRKEMENAETGLVAQAFVDLNQSRLHSFRRIYLERYMSI